MKQQFEAIERPESKREQLLRELKPKLQQAERDVERYKFLIAHVDWAS